MKTKLFIIAFLLFLSTGLLTNVESEVKIMGNLKVASDAFEDGGDIPVKYTAKGEEISPPLSIDNVDPNAVSIAIIVDDPFIGFLPITHWLVYNIPANITEIEEGIPIQKVVDKLGGAYQGKNFYRKNGYMGPNPRFGKHTYRFYVYTLDSMLNLEPGASKRKLQKAMEEHILQCGMVKGEF